MIQVNRGADVLPSSCTICPICEASLLVQVAPEVWQCANTRCNNEFFIDGEPGQRTLNVRDKPGFVRPTSRQRRVQALLLRAAMILLAVAVMYNEGQHQRTPGIGFGFALVLILGAVIPWKRL